MTQSTEFGWVARFLLRPLFIFLSFMLVLFALLQATGRVSMLALKLFDEQIALVTEPFGVGVHGLVGDWSGFNPMIKAQRIEFRGGYAQGIHAELDVPESILRSAWVLKGLKIDELFLDLVQTEQGWQLRNQGDDPVEFDLSDLLAYSDELQTNVRVSLRNTAGVHSELTAALRLASHSEMQHLSVQVDSGMGQHQLSLKAWQTQTFFAQDEEQLAFALAGSIKLPDALNVGDVLIDVEQADWSSQSSDGGGDIKLRATIDSSGLRSPIVAELHTQLRSVAGELWGHINKAEIAAGTTKLDLADGRFQVAFGDEETTARVRYWQQQLDLARIRSFLTRSFGREHVVGRWTSGTALVGTAHNLQAFYTPNSGWGYSATLSDLSMRGHRGAPGVTQAQGRVWGYARGAAIQVNAEHSTLNFPDLFTATWSLDFLQGTVKAYFADGYLGLRGANLKTRISESTVAGAFSLTRPQEQFEQRVALELHVDEAGMDNVRSFIPYKIPDDLSEWLEYGPISGDVRNASFAYHGQVHKRIEDGMHRRIELVADMANTAVQYEKSWPIVDELDGRLHVAGQEIRVDVVTARSNNVSLTSGQVVLRDNAAYADASLQISGEGQDLLNFVRASPLQENLNFITDQWRSAGEMQMQASLLVPIKVEEAPPLKVGLDYVLRDFALDMPEYRTRLDGLNGRGSFALPHNVTGELTGELFERPANIAVNSDVDWIRFDITGTARPEDIYRVAGLDELSILKGSFDFDSRFSVAMSEAGITNLELRSDMFGMEVLLPAQLGKSAAQTTPLELDVQFLSDYQSIRWRYQPTQGWIHFKDAIQRGAIGINDNPPVTDHNRQAILIAGSLPSVLLSDWVSGDGDAAIALPLDWSMQRLEIGEFQIDELSFADVQLRGKQTGSVVEFAMQSSDLAGNLKIPGQGLVEINLDYIKLPETQWVTATDALLAEAGYQQAIAIPALDIANADPISVDVGYSLPAAKVSVAQLDLGDKPFGRWSFVIEPQANGVQFHNFSLDVNGVHVNDADVHWDLVTNQSYFQGVVELDDLKETLPLWDYAPALETETASLVVDSRWPGSPANVSLLDLKGELRFKARNGRFLEVDSGGGLRVLSLLNFSNIAKRISFDFSDVTKEGMGFDRISARVSVNEGDLRFIDRMEVESKSSNFQIGGQVDLHTGILNNEMIVTLPVSDSLPWYGVYLAIANPLAGLGVLVGERVLRKPLRAFSTAKFEVKGTLEEPQVNFVSLWDQSMRESKEPQEAPRATEDAVSDEPASEAEEPEKVGRLTLDANEIQLGGK